MEPSTILTVIGGMIAAGALGRVGEDGVVKVASTAKKFLSKLRNKSAKTKTLTESTEQTVDENIINNLKSETGIDYSELERLLKKAYNTDNEDYWRKADFETYRLMLRAVAPEKSGWISRKEMRNFPCSDLQIINSLWLKYSNGKFGFSVQNEIWKALRDKHSWDWVSYGKKFTEHVGWLNAQGSLKERDDLNFSLNAPRGYLPYILRTTGKLRKESDYWLFSYLSSRLDACSIL